MLVGWGLTFIDNFPRRLLKDLRRRRLPGSCSLDILVATLQLSFFPLNQQLQRAVCIMCKETFSKEQFEHTATEQAAESTRFPEVINSPFPCLNFAFYLNYLNTALSETV